MDDDRDTGWLGDAHGGPCPTPPPLPDGVSRGEQCHERQTLEAANELRIAIRVFGGGLNHVTVRRDEPPSIRPAPRERIRDLRPGDRVKFATSGAPADVVSIEIVR